ncbi:MAG: hypothetical protein OEQ39_27290, partial [Gammaproteobacteria bacterium]|nr:hypothetical protein [Gammaproteobacteria bacterium]
TDRKAIIAGVLTDKSQVLSGEASTIISHMSETPEPTIDDYRAKVDEARRVYDITDSEGDNPDQKGHQDDDPGPSAAGHTDDTDDGAICVDTEIRSDT